MGSIRWSCDQSSLLKNDVFLSGFLDQCTSSSVRTARHALTDNIRKARIRRLSMIAQLRQTLERGICDALGQAPVPGPLGRW